MGDPIPGADQDRVRSQVYGIFKVLSAKQILIKEVDFDTAVAQYPTFCLYQDVIGLDPGIFRRVMDIMQATPKHASGLVSIFKQNPEVMALYHHLSPDLAKLSPQMWQQDQRLGKTRICTSSEKKTIQNHLNQITTFAAGLGNRLQNRESMIIPDLFDGLANIIIRKVFSTRDLTQYQVLISPTENYDFEAIKMLVQSNGLMIFGWESDYRIRLTNDIGYLPKNINEFPGHPLNETHLLTTLTNPNVSLYGIEKAITEETQPNLFKRVLYSRRTETRALPKS